MPLTPVACPSCGNILQANALDKAGTVATPCRECGDAVYVQTDEEGRIEAIYAGLAGEAAYGEEEAGAARQKLPPLVPLLLGLLAALLFGWLILTRSCAAPPLPRQQVATPTPLPPTPTATPAPRIVLDRESGVTFDTGKATLTEVSKLRLEEIAKRLVAVPASQYFEINGHTDDIGDEAANLKLSQARAETVKQFLSKHGIAAARLTTRGLGSSDPVALNTTPEGRERNRRIEIVTVNRPVTAR